MIAFYRLVDHPHSPRILGLIAVMYTALSLKMCAQEMAESNLSLPVNFSSVQGLSFTTDVHVQLLKPIFSLTPSDFFETTATFTLTNKIEPGAAFPDILYSVVQRQGSVVDPSSAEEVRSYKTAFNGSELQMMTYPEGRLSISRVVPSYDTVVYDANGLFLPFRFISEKQASTEGEFEKLTDVCSPKQWFRIQEIIKSGNFKISADQRYITFDVKIYSEKEKEDVVYEVTLDKQSKMFPVHWNMKDSNGKMLQDYQVTELAVFPTSRKLPQFFYPKVAVLSDYKDGDIISKSTVTTANLRFATGDINSDDFTIDPASANLIWDNDKEVLVHVPK